MICRICGIEKPEDEFYTRKDKGLVRLRTECKDCLKERVRFRKTGVSQKQYEEAFIKQRGRCAICNSTLNQTKYTKLSVDHDHKTGKFRALLCGGCNTGLGLFKESIERLSSAIKYLQKHKGIVQPPE